MPKIWETFGIAKMPWVMRVYLLLFFTSVALLVFASSNYANSEIAGNLFSVAGDSLKLVIGAVVGSLSMAARSKWDPDESKTEESEA